MRHIRLQNYFKFFLIAALFTLIIYYVFLPNLLLFKNFRITTTLQINDLKKINERIWNSIQTEIKSNKKHIDCKRIISGDENYINLQTNSRLIYNDTDNLLMDCKSIKERNYFLEKSLSNKERKFPFAYARIVYQDYRFLEAELATNYQPQNWYCFAIDSKANENFYKKVKSLANCFKNIIIPKERVPVESNGHNMGAAFMTCLKELSKKEKHWEYVFTLQNDDIQIKTNEEIVQILKWLNGANDVEFEFRQSETLEMLNKLHQQFNWTFKDLNLFKDEKLNNQIDSKGKLLSLQLSKGYVQTSLTRPFVDFIANKLNLNKMLEHLDTWIYASDEMFFQTLIASDDLKATNAFTRKCIERKTNIPYTSRFTIWKDDGSLFKCYSGNWRNSLCVFGVEDLSKNLRDNKYIFANKVQSEFDFGAALCWHEEMRNRTFIKKGLNRLNNKLYQNWPQTRFHKEMLKTGKVDFNKFNCNQY